MKTQWRVYFGILIGVSSLLGAAEVVELSPYTVEAWHFDQLGVSVPADVLRVDGAEIAASGLATVPEVLEQLAGVQFRGFTGNGTEGQLAMRGFGDNSGLRVLVLVDGLEYNPPDMGGINWQGLDAGELETVEVIRGGQSVLYGNHAVSGVVKLRTRPAGSGGLRLRMEAGGESLYGGGLSGGRTFGEIGVRAGGHFSRTDGYRENAQSESESTYIAWRMGEEAEASWNGRVQMDRTAVLFPGPLDYGQMRENPEQSLNSGNDKADTQALTASVAGRGESALGEWEAVAGFLDRDREWGLDGSYADNRQRRLSLKPRVKIPLGEAFLITGVDLALDELERNDFVDPERGIVRAEGDIERTTLGAYAFVSAPFGNGWQLSGGIRVESARTDNLYARYQDDQLLPVLETNRGPVPNPRYRNPPELDPDLSFDGIVEKGGWAAEISLLKEWGGGYSAWAGWDRVYRYPAIDETASFQGYPLAAPLNADLDPETGDNFEMGIKRGGDNWHLGATAFLMDLDDEIVFDEEIPLNVNFASSRRRGVELDAEWRHERWGLSGRMAWIRARFTGGEYGDQMPLVPEYELGVTGWIQPADDWRVRLNWRHLSEQVQGNDFFNTERRIRAYGLVSATVFWKPNDDFSVHVAVDNLFDELYAVTAYNGGFYPGSGRRVRAGMNLSF